MPKTLHVVSPANGLVLHGYVGDYVAMLVWTLDEHLTTQHAGLAGFSITRTPPGGAPINLLNLLNFTAPVTPANDAAAAASQAQQTAVPSTQAPFQTFRWIDYPSQQQDGQYTYEVTAMYFSDPHSTSNLIAGTSATVTLEFGPMLAPNVSVAFTRGFISSQAYARTFDNAPFRPDDRSEYLFDTAPFEKQYAWCGRRGRSSLFAFLDGALADRKAGKAVTLDAFIYDIDEPDFVRRLQDFGDGLRVFLDDSQDKPKKGPPKPKADRENAVGALPNATIRRGHFKRFAHDKVLIRRDDGKPTSVLCGSANYSVRGLYVQSNSIIVISHPSVAEAYQNVFDEAFASPQNGEWKALSSAETSRRWFKYQQPDLPQFGVSFAPHPDGNFGLNAVAKMLDRAQKNVIFAIMSEGSGIAQTALEKDIGKKAVFTFGTVQNTNFEVKLVAAGKTGAGGKYGAYKPLAAVVPEPFLSELNVGMGGGANAGQVIHHKFVVVDFNGVQPTVYCGSSNLARGGEQQNGDNLMGFYNAEIATAFAIEGIQLADHYSFRLDVAASSKSSPLLLQGPGANVKWYADYYTPGTKHYRELQSLAG